ncbi:hypothetical protein JKP88DRAFT_218561 [Tribonema minus]|uniref:Uncharacterized protein n=1 Tax=Tribonema minus TaxID=303371 RepID=A0A836CIJ0_9STRA|nr:hypothetical protein JKP88DRAFT_218561 [Tribonema minus]
MAEGSVIDGALVVRDVVYTLVAAPAADSYLVQDAKTTVLQGVNLNQVVENLDWAAELMFLAYCSVQGTRLAPTINARHQELLELCFDSSMTMSTMQQKSNDVVDRLVAAYRMLLAGNEDAAITKLKTCAAHAAAMADTCEALAQKYAAMTEVTKKDSAAAQEMVAEEGEVQAALLKARDEMRAVSAEQKAMQQDLKLRLDDVIHDIDSETKREDIRAGRAHGAAVANLVLKAFGTAFSGAVNTVNNLNPLSVFRPNANTTTDTDQPAASPATETAGDAASDVDSAASAAAAKARSLRLDLLMHKRTLEEKNNKALGKIAELTERLSANMTDQAISKSSQAALEMASFAFNNIHVSLLEATQFWRYMQRGCESLANPRVIETIEDEVSTVQNRDQRTQYYQEDFFVRGAMNYLTQWTALATICGEYKIAVNTAADRVKSNLRLSPTIKEAKAKLEGLRTSTRMRVQRAQTASDLAIAEANLAMRAANLH